MSNQNPLGGVRVVVLVRERLTRCSLVEIDMLVTADAVTEVPATI